MNTVYNNEKVKSAIISFLFFKQIVGKCISPEDIVKEIKVGNQTKEIEDSLRSLIELRLVDDAQAGYVHLNPEYFDQLNKAFSNVYN